jgi:dienelactone hydrolase
LTDVSDGTPGAVGAAAAPQRTNIPELKAYEKTALAAQELGRSRDTAAQALASAQEAQRALLKYVEQFRETTAGASAMDVVNGARAVMKLPYVDDARIGMWGHSMGGTVSWQVLASDFGKQVRAYTQISSFPNVTDEQLKQIRCPVFMVAGTVGSLEERIVNRLPNAVERLTKAGVPFEAKVYPGYSHHAMKYGEALADALAFLRKHVM